MSRKVAFIGKASVTEEEAEELDLLGSLLGSTDRTLITTNHPGANQSVREGYERQGVEATLVPSGAFELADLGIAYVDDQLHDRLKTAGILDKFKVTVLHTYNELFMFVQQAIYTVHTGRANAQRAEPGNEIAPESPSTSRDLRTSGSSGSAR